jgi:hypothetical protein
MASAMEAQSELVIDPFGIGLGVTSARPCIELTSDRSLLCSFSGRLCMFWTPPLPTAHWRRHCRQPGSLSSWVIGAAGGRSVGFRCRVSPALLP